MTRVLFTGTRAHSEPRLVLDAIDRLSIELCHNYPPDFIYVNGDCPHPTNDPEKKSVDKLVQEWCDAYEDAWMHEDHPANWYPNGYRDRSAGPKRNKKMVDLGAVMCFAFPEGESRGTRGCAKMAQEAGIPTLIIELEHLKSGAYIRMIDWFVNGEPIVTEYCEF